MRRKKYRLAFTVDFDVAVTPLSCLRDESFPTTLAEILVGFFRAL
jgi:hypothetical protein